MDNYDDEDEEVDLATRVLGGGGKGAGVVLPEDDPYMTNKEADEDDSDIEDFTLRESDLVLLAARNEDDVSHLEVYVYEQGGEDGAANLYVHHDIMLAAFPLSLAWMDLDPAGSGASGSYVAVGTFDPAIEIWDLDVMDPIEPAAVLGGTVPPPEPEPAAAPEEDQKKSKKKKSKKKASKAAPVLKEGSHSDAVMSLSWNREYRHVLASGSADCTVKVWDITKQACEHTLTHHKGKVQGVAWNPKASGSDGRDQGGWGRRLSVPQLLRRRRTCCSREGTTGSRACWTCAARGPSRYGGS